MMPTAPVPTPDLPGQTPQPRPGPLRPNDDLPDPGGRPDEAPPVPGSDLPPTPLPQPPL